MSIPFTYIYLIYDPLTMLFKIGKSDKPTERFKQLCNPASYGTIPAAPTNYVFLQAWLCPESDEARLHGHFANYRVRGEWFDLKPHFIGEPDRDDRPLPEKTLEGFEQFQMEYRERLITPPDLPYRKTRLHDDSAQNFCDWMDACEEIRELRRFHERSVLLGYDPLQLKAAPDEILEAT